MDLKEKVYEFIVEYERRYPNQYPGTGLMAAWFKTSKEAIRLKLVDLDEEGRIKRIKTDVNFTDYKLVKFYRL